MKYSKERKEEILKSIFEKIETGVSLRKSLMEVKLAAKTFFEWIDADAERSKQYARAKEMGIDARFDSIEEDYNATPRLDDNGRVDSGWVALQRLKVDAKKWELSKLAPKKYGDKIDITSGGEKVITPTSINVSVILPDED